MSDALDRGAEADGRTVVLTTVASGGVASAGAGRAGGAERADIRDIRGGARKARGSTAGGSTVTDDNVLRAVETTIEVAESVLLAATRAVDAGKRHNRRAAVTPAGDRANDFRFEPEGMPSLRADILPSSGLPRNPRARWRSLAQWGFAGTASVLVAVMIAGNPLSGGRPVIGSGPGPHAPAGTSPAAAAVEPAAGPRLVVGSAERGGNGQALPLGVAINHPADAAGLLIDGLPDGASLSAGQPSGANQWYVPAAELAGAVVRPPRGFAGAVDLSVELRLARGRVAERRSVRLEWARAPAPPTQAVGIAGLPQRTLDPEEIASLRKRGEEFFANGDIAAARLMLMRAAEAADARAAFLLATTYDPLVLGDSGIRGSFANPALARTWYERAKAFGSPDAPRRLELLASREY
jgi:hypothetical protein